MFVIKSGRFREYHRKLKDRIYRQVAKTLSKENAAKTKLLVQAHDREMKILEKELQNKHRRADQKLANLEQLESEQNRVLNNLKSKTCEVNTILDDLKAQRRNNNRHIAVLLDSELTMRRVGQETGISIS